MVVDHLFRLIDVKKEDLPLYKTFPDDKLFVLIQSEMP